MPTSAYAAITPAIRWLAEGRSIDPRLLPLLQAVSATGSLNKAVASLGLSYRHAWGLIGDTERMLGRSLVVMDRGRGARLSPFSVKLLEADATAAQVLERELAATVRALGRATPLTLHGRRGQPLVIHASHDFALSELRDRLLAAGVPVELHFHGSLDCLASLARRECDLAGFHVPTTPAGSEALAPFRPWLQARGLRLIGFVNRRQGLMVAPGNPKGLRTLADIAGKHARFVNRQPESGTRLCFDRLLAASGVDPARINGYRNEEFTHAAVAATIASGMADAGFGIEAAARRHHLEFVALVDERYFLAARAPTLSRPDLRRLLEAVRGDALRRWIAAQPGYDAAGMGDVMTPREALRPDGALRP